MKKTKPTKSLPKYEDLIDQIYQQKKKNMPADNKLMFWSKVMARLSNNEKK